METEQSNLSDGTKHFVISLLSGLSWCPSSHAPTYVHSRWLYNWNYQYIEMGKYCIDIQASEAAFFAILHRTCLAWYFLLFLECDSIFSPSDVLVRFRLTNTCIRIVVFSCRDNVPFLRAKNPSSCIALPASGVHQCSHKSLATVD